MTKEEYVEKAIMYKHSGYNCCQSVVKAFSDIIGMDEDAVNSLAAGFGVGMGCMEGTCGSLVGAVMTAGAVTGGKGTVGVAAKLLKSFEDRCGATICRDLKGRDTGIVLCSCDDCVKNAVEILADML